MNNQQRALFLKRILDNLTDAVLLFDASLTLVYINMPGEMLFAVSSRHIVGMPAQQIFLHSDQGVEADMARALATGVSLTHRNILLYQPAHSITVNAGITPLLDEVAPLLLVQLQQVDRHLKISMEEQLQAQQSASKMLLRGLAHEIKNPLGGIRGAAQLLDRELQDEEQREYTRIIIEESDRLQSLVDRMLAPHKPALKSLLNIHKVLERVRQLVQVETPTTVRLIRDYDPSIPPVYGDSDQLIQAILNVVRNAAEAIGRHGEITIRTRVSRQITLSNKRHPLVVKIDVMDNGPGIKPELINQIFYPMVTGRAEGSGLGLSIAQTLISQHGGLIECSSAPGQTVFSIFLPVEAQNE